MKISQVSNKIYLYAFIATLAVVLGIVSSCNRKRLAPIAQTQTNFHYEEAYRPPSAPPHVLTIAAAKKLIQQSPADSNSYKQLALAYYKAGDYKEATVQLNRALEQGASDAEIYYYLALSLRASDNNQQALAFLQKASITPNYRDYAAVIHLTIGNIYYDQGNLKEADKQYKLSLRQDSNSPAACFGRGLVLGQQGNYMLARRYFHASAFLTDDKKEKGRAFAGIGMCDEKLGKRTAAREEYQRALRLYPGYAPAQQGLKRVQ